MIYYTLGGIMNFKETKRIRVLNLFLFLLLVVSCADTTGKTSSCVIDGCVDTEKICNEDTGKCEYAKRCTETGCSDDKVCNDITGLCEDKPNCIVDGCSNTQYCDSITRECVDNCYDGKCQNNETCDNLTGLCKPDCSKVTCQDNFKCDPTNALCKAECLNQGSCEVTEHCNEESGVCDLNCPEGKCEANERCVPLSGVCEIDCSLVTCQEDSQLCDPSDGVCKVACEVNKCENKQACNQTTGLCEDTVESQYQMECTENEDCLSNLCIEVGESKQCSLNCNILESCGNGWDCAPYNDESICAPILNNSCDTCNDDADCSIFGGKCLEINGIKSCLDSCEYSDNCATGFSCTNTDINGDIFKLCSPNGNSCDCNNDNINLTLSCDIGNEFGTCKGSKVCTETGWSECGGQTPSLDICDGIDNNCDGLVDNVEVVACQNGNEVGTCFGSLTCQNGVEFCDARTPVAESCNGIDDDCNGEIDELEDLGCRTTNQIGSCSGVQICNGETGWGECNAPIAVIEVCDGVDNDCNSEIDDALDGYCELSNEFGICSGERRCLGSAGWDDCDAKLPSLDVCDGVDNNCNTQIDEENEHLFDNCSNMANANLSCTNGACALIDCKENYYNIDQDNSNGCEYSCIFDTFQDIPDGIDHNCDGIDGNINDAYFVSSRIGIDSNSGTKSSPFKTISYAMNRAKILGKSQILVSAGDYNEDLVIENDGVSIFGGYDDINWNRNVTSNVSKILVPAHGIQCNTITQETYIDGFTINSANATVYPENSIGINIIGSGNNLMLRNLIINAGNGMRGTIGINGEVGANGGNGGNGGPGSDDNEDNPGAGGAGGVNPFCPQANGGNGGGGGHDGHYDGYYGLNGVSGILGGAGGTGSGGDGSGGHSGTVNGANGANGLGGTSSGSIINGLWIGNSGNSGDDGVFGAGAGGGGGGAGQNGTWVNNGAGAGGGGGSAGGCGGQGGIAGKAGTGSFGIFLNNSNPTVENIHINAGFGGNGGVGSTGGAGGSPGTAGIGGNGGGESGNGGNGGFGKSGGSGGAGGGGAGGVSYCIYRFNSNPNLESWTCTTSLGGNGGYSSGYSGETGDSGDIY
jgi:hypothetical protein